MFAICYPFSLFSFTGFCQVCDRQKAVTLADLAHSSGLVAAGVIPSLLIMLM